MALSTQHQCIYIAYNRISVAHVLRFGNLPLNEVFISFTANCKTKRACHWATFDHPRPITVFDRRAVSPANQSAAPHALPRFLWVNNHWVGVASPGWLHVTAFNSLCYCDRSSLTTKHHFTIVSQHLIDDLTWSPANKNMSCYFYNTVDNISYTNILYTYI